MLTVDDKNARMAKDIQKFCEELVKEFGSYRKAGEALGIDHQRIAYYEKKSKNLQKFLNFVEHAEKKLDAYRKSKKRKGEHE